MRSAWNVLVPVVLLLAGFGFAVSAHDSRGTDLRAPGTADLADLVRTGQAQVKALDGTAAALQEQVADTVAQAGRGNSGVAAAQRQVDALRAPAGLTAVHGPGIEVILNDAAAASGPATTGVDPNQLVVHQSDLQAAVNALWAGGAEAMSIAGQRVVATSAVRCVGNTLLLGGEVYSPPYRIQAIGPYREMDEALNASPGVRLFQQAASYYGLGYTAESRSTLHLPAYRGSITLDYAKATR